jgi:FixJ family two-component response regulator
MRRIAAALRRHPAGADAVVIELLTERELEVLLLLATGKSNAELAAQLFSARERSRPTSRTSSPSSDCATGCQAVVFAYETELVHAGNAPG